MTMTMTMTMTMMIVSVSLPRNIRGSNVHRLQTLVSVREINLGACTLVILRQIIITGPGTLRDLTLVKFWTDFLLLKWAVVF